MRYPTGETNKADFDRLWYNAQAFGAVTSYGRHEGVDINLRTGGDTDLGRELVAIAPGKITYYHHASHPVTGFGRHMAYKIEGPWGTRWIHYAHLDSFEPAVRDVAEGQVIAKLGKTGTQYAHLHWSVWKVDPASNGGIDNYANTEEELHQKWEDPIAFVEKWLVAPAPTDYKKLYEEALVTINDKNQQIGNLQNQVNGFNFSKAKFKTDLKNYIDNYQI